MLTDRTDGVAVQKEISMKRILIAVFGVAALMAFPAVGSAQTHHAANSPKAEFHLSQPLTVGTETLKPADYKFQCLKINGEDVLVVTSADNGREVARVPCKPEALATKTETSEIRSVPRADGSNVLSGVRIKGETVAHRVVMN
jgi:hypothetical protein